MTKNINKMTLDFQWKDMNGGHILTDWLIINDKDIAIINPSGFGEGKVNALFAPDCCNNKEKIITLDDTNRSGYKNVFKTLEHIASESIMFYHMISRHLCYDSPCSKWIADEFDNNRLYLYIMGYKVAEMRRISKVVIFHNPMANQKEFYEDTVPLNSGLIPGADNYKNMKREAEEIIRDEIPDILNYLSKLKAVFKRAREKTTCDRISVRGEYAVHQVRFFGV